MKRIGLILIMFVWVLSCMAQWIPDCLGDGYMMRHVEMPDDYSGKVRATIIRKKAVNADRAVLYIHGYNDYFFQKEMGDRFVDSCYNFYAVDLRKYGRSILPGQIRFQVRDLSEYFADIDSALTEIKNDGNKSVFLMGHSTGGLIVAYYMAKNDYSKYNIHGIILNSPFFDMNLSKFNESIAVPLVSFISPLFRNIKVSQGEGNAYAMSLLKKYHGEWEYNTRWKLEVSPAVYSSWIGAIHKAHVFIQKGTDIKVPILLMFSDKSVYGSDWTPMHNAGDAVLDVNDIYQYGIRLGGNIHCLRVHDGLHDLMLSRKSVREALYKSMFKWIDTLN